MPQLSPKLWQIEGPMTVRLAHWCPGCKDIHQIQILAARADCGPVWHWNGSAEAPTTTPSLLHQGRTHSRCHYFLREGRIEYCGDCEHEFSGQAIELPDIPAESLDWLKHH